MPTLFVFQKQSIPKQHILESLLITLSFTVPLESKHIKSIVRGFVRNERVYVSNQKTRGWLKKQDDLLTLTSQARLRVKSSSMELLNKKTTGDTKLRHEILLSRCLFLCLVHLEFSAIRQIKKQRHSHYTSFIPDLTLITDIGTFFIEVDTGSQPVQTLEAKINDFQAQNLEGTLIYFTNSPKTYTYFSQQASVQFVNLQSPTLSGDIEKLSHRSISDSHSTGVQTFYNPVSMGMPNIILDPTANYNPYPIRNAQNLAQEDLTTGVAHNNPLLYQGSQKNYDERRQQLIKLLFDDSSD